VLNEVKALPWRRRNPGHHPALPRLIRFVRNHRQSVGRQLGDDQVHVQAAAVAVRHGCGSRGAWLDRSGQVAPLRRRGSCRKWNSLGRWQASQKAPRQETSRSLTGDPPHVRHRAFSHHRGRARFHFVLTGELFLYPWHLKTGFSIITGRRIIRLLFIFI